MSEEWRHPLPGGAAFLPGTRVNELACAAQGKTGLVFANLIFASTIFLHLFLLSLRSSPFSPLAPLSMQIWFLSTAHAINSHFSTGSRRHTSAPVGNRSSAPVPSTSTPPPEASRFAPRCSWPPTTTSDEHSAAGWPVRERATEGAEGRREEARNSVRIGRPAGQSAAERRK